MPELIFDEKPNEKDIEVIEEGLREFNRRHTGLDRPEKRAIYIRDAHSIKGGIVYLCMKPWGRM